MHGGLLAIDAWLLALVCAIPAWSLWIPRQLRVQAQLIPEQRARLLLALALAPWLCAWLVVLLAWLPSMLVSEGLVGDWCLSQPARQCPMHAREAAGNAAAPVLATLTFALALLMGLRLLRMLHAALRVARGLGLAVVHSESIEGVRVDVVRADHALALALSLPTLRVVVSDSVRAALDRRELAALVEHERAHLARRDGYVGLLVSMASSVLPPAPRRALRAAWHLAAEQACDRVAAYRAGRLTLASALLKYSRLARSTAAPAGVASFGEHELQLRVQALLEEPHYQARQPTAWAWRALALLVPLAFGLHELGEFALLPLVR